MFGYFLSVGVAFIVFGCTFNVLKKINNFNFAKDDELMCWAGVLIASLLWFVVIPCSFVLLIVFLLKLITDRISNFILKRVEK
ncbi:MAG: hypothetical protein [Caudoviricetes sp.]|nr:MAG: hypothetical protein [Caudoviricetes sp.]